MAAIVENPGAERSRDPVMKQQPRLGLRGERSITVGPENRISIADARMPPVLATPWLIAELEYTARDALSVCLEPHERSVGVSVQVEHLAPAPEGFTVTCRARVIHVNGPIVTFQVEAHDEAEPIARGLHQRAVIDVDRFARRIERKRQSRSG
jgi:fluoroacetyl-CoA thioesterase